MSGMMFGILFAMLCVIKNLSFNQKDARREVNRRKMDLRYEQATTKPRQMPPPLGPDTLPEFSREHLIQLLTYLEGELEARELAIQHLKEEKAKLLCFEARYALMCPGDPLHALCRDSQAVEGPETGVSVTEMYESQLDQLEKLISIYRDAQLKTKHMLNWTEKRHSRTLRELELEREERLRGAENNDNVRAILERENGQLVQQLDVQLAEVASCKAELAAMERRLEAEKEKHKHIVLFLIGERKEMLLTIHEMHHRLTELQPKLEASSNPPVSSASSSESVVAELKKELIACRADRDALRAANKLLKADVSSMREVIQAQEEELLYKQNLVPASATIRNSHNPQMEERSLVVANRIALGSSAPSRTRLSNSSSFPSEKSRLPRAPSSPARSSTASKPTASGNAPSGGNNSKKNTPSMGISTMRRVVSSASSTSHSSADAEMSQLDAAIEAMSEYSRSDGVRRSTSLSRGRSEPRQHQQVSHLEPRQSPLPPNVNSMSEQNRPLAHPPTRLPSKGDRPPTAGSISSSSKTRTSLLRAFGAK